MPKYTIEHRKFLKECREEGLGIMEIHNIWSDCFPEEPCSYDALAQVSITMLSWPGTWEDYLKYYLEGRRRPYINKEIEWLEKNTHLRRNYKELGKAWFAKFGYGRPPAALAKKIMEITGIGNQLEKPEYSHEDIDDFPQKWLDEKCSSTVKLKSGTKYIGSYAKYPFVCDKGHEFQRNYNSPPAGCPICSSSFVGGLPIGSDSALTYLLGFPEWKKCKIGYAEIGNSLSPEEAIHRTSKGRGYPYPYIIVAYDLSTKTDAAILEERLKTSTIESEAFLEKQEFTGWTEFRKIEVVKQILPQFKTVLDTALKI